MTIYVPGKVTLKKEFTWNESVWNPSMISTALWLDAADASTITESGGAVSQWDDKSGNGRHVTQGTPENRPTYNVTGLNGKATVDWPTSINSAGLQNTSTYSPGRLIGVADYDGSNPFDAYNGLVTFNYSVDSDILVTTEADTVWYGYYPVFLNGSSAASSTALPTILSPFIFASNASISSSRTNTYIGTDREFVNRGWVGKIAEIIILPTAPSTYERNRIEGYLAHKWGLTANLPNDHPYKLVGPTP